MKMLRKLGRKKAHREHTLRNLVTSLVLYEQIDTTEAKAKETKRLVDKVIARAKGADLAAVKYLNAFFFDKNAVAKITEELVKRYQDRTSGFSRTYRLKNRLGDNAPMMRLELVDKKVFVAEKSEKIAESKAETETKVKDVKTKVRVRKNAKE